MKNITECLSQCGCNNESFLENFNSIENHGNYFLINFNIEADLGDCKDDCSNSFNNCCENIFCSIIETDSHKSLKIETQQANQMLLSSIMNMCCCTRNTEEKCCYDENRKCC